MKPHVLYIGHYQKLTDSSTQHTFIKNPLQE